MQLDPRLVQAALLGVAALVAAGYGLTMNAGVERIAVLAGAALMLVGAIAAMRRPPG